MNALSNQKKPLQQSTSFLLLQLNESNVSLADRTRRLQDALDVARAEGVASLEKPLFFPLKREHFEAFRCGEKQEEYRLYGPRWNEQTCQIGRRVTLSLGYGKKKRLHGVVSSFRIEFHPGILKGWSDCYGGSNDFAAVIGIKLESGAEA